MDEVQIWKTKKILKNLKNARGNGTSMISLIIPPKECISRSTRLLTDEYGTASNIKSRVNKNSVLSAIVSAQAKLKTYSKTPANGLAIYVGTVVEDNKEKKVSIGIEPIKPINTSLYMCDSKFHVDDLLRQYEDESKFGIIVMDGHGTLFSTVQGNVKTILQELTVDLPKKHGRGGQSSVRFARLRLEKRLTYIKKVAEIMNGIYLTDSKINVEGLILAGHSDFKNELKTCDVLDHKIREKIVKIVDVNYGGENGLNQAIELCEDVLKELKLSKEKNILKSFFEEMALDGKYCYSIKDTIHCLESGCIDILIVWENLTDKKGEEDFVDWISENYKDFGCDLIFVTDKSAEGTQFVEAFGGIGGILRYKVEGINDFSDYESIDDNEIF